MGYTGPQPCPHQRIFWFNGIISVEDVYVYEEDQSQTKFKTTQMVKAHLVCVSSGKRSLRWLISVVNLMGSRITTERQPRYMLE